jgi:hypothetical protein
MSSSYNTSLLNITGKDPTTIRFLKIAERCILLAEQGNSVALEIIQEK